MFDFLDSVELVEVVEETKEVVSRKLEYNPTNGADFRVFADGRIFPSLALVEELGLEYTDKDAAKGNGFDVFSTKAWDFYPKNAPAHAVLISVVSKALPKVDVFSTTRYNADGSPISSVIDQGASTFGKELLLLLEDVYNPEPANLEEAATYMPLLTNKKFIDLKILTAKRIATKDDIYYIPKMVTKGKDAGSIEHIRRENLSLHPLAIYTDAMAQEYATSQVEAVTEQEGSDVIS
jgi:hypothetical protein